MSAAPRCFDGDINLLHSHHRLKRAFCFIAADCERLGQNARCDLPGDAPLVFAPPAFAFLTATADDCVPVAICLFLFVSGDLKREGYGIIAMRRFPPPWAIEKLKRASGWSIRMDRTKATTKPVRASLIY